MKKNDSLKQEIGEYFWKGILNASHTNKMEVAKALMNYPDLTSHLGPQFDKKGLSSKIETYSAKENTKSEHEKVAGIASVLSSVGQSLTNESANFHFEHRYFTATTDQDGDFHIQVNVNAPQKIKEPLEDIARRIESGSIAGSPAALADHYAQIANRSDQEILRTYSLEPEDSSLLKFSCKVDAIPKEGEKEYPIERGVAWEMVPNTGVTLKLAAAQNILQRHNLELDNDIKSNFGTGPINNATRKVIADVSVKLIRQAEQECLAIEQKILANIGAPLTTHGSVRVRAEGPVGNEHWSLEPVIPKALHPKIREEIDRINHQVKSMKASGKLPQTPKQNQELLEKLLKPLRKAEANLLAQAKLGPINGANINSSISKDSLGYDYAALGRGHQSKVPENLTLYFDFRPCLNQEGKTALTLGPKPGLPIDFTMTKIFTDLHDRMMYANYVYSRPTGNLNVFERDRYSKLGSFLGHVPHDSRDFEARFHEYVGDATQALKSTNYLDHESLTREQRVNSLRSDDISQGRKKRVPIESILVEEKEFLNSRSSTLSANVDEKIARNTTPSDRTFSLQSMPASDIEKRHHVHEVDEDSVSIKKVDSTQSRIYRAEKADCKGTFSKDNLVKIVNAGKRLFIEPFTQSLEKNTSESLSKTKGKKSGRK